MLCTSKSGCCRGTAGHCKMMCRSVKSRQKFRACNGIARDLSREESSSEIKRVEIANEKRRQGESESAGVNGDERGRRGWSVKSKQSDAQREIELRERVSLFFINRPIKQERTTPLDVLFCLAPAPFPSARSFRISFPLSCFPLFSLLFCPFFIAVANPSARVSVSPSVRLTSFLSANLLFLLRREETHPLSAGLAAEREEFSFCYFIQLFREREDSFYYLGAQLQCLADNKPMKATFEPEGPLKSPFSPTSRFFFVSHTYSRFLSSSSSRMFPRSHSFSLYRWPGPLSPFFLT